MAEFVKVSGAHLAGKYLGVSLGEVPEVVQIKNNARGRIRGVGVSLQAAGPLKETQKVGFEALIQHGLIRNGLVKCDNRFGSVAELGRQARADVVNARCGQGMEIGFQGFRLGLRLGFRKTGKVRMGQKSS